MNVSVLLPLGRESARNVACLESLGRTLPPRWRGEIVLIASDGHVETATGLRGALPSKICCRVLPSSATLQAAAATVSAPVLCFVDPGTVFLPGWLPPMLRVLRAASRAGCVGNIQREPYSGLIDHAGIGFDADGLPSAVGRDRALLPRDRFDRRAAVSMACCLVRREVFERLGGFDPCFHGPLGGVDFCLRAAGAGYRHYVANRSVVYHDDDDTPGSLADDPDLPLYRERWGHRARACHQRREGLRLLPPGASFTPEHWEMARETRRLLRIEAREVRGEGRRYLAKHWFRPWRYNGQRVSRALGQAWQPLPAPLPPVPGYPDDSTRLDDGWLFDPPPQP